ncbi:MAG: hypothetical protein AABY22_16120, partial [Nanoarchaeota archaeon]
KKLLELNTAIYQIDSVKKDRLTRTLNQFREWLKYPLEQYNKKLNDINEEFCSMDAEGNYFIDEQKLPIYTKFTKEKSKIRNQKVDALLEEEVELNICDCKDLSRIKKLHISAITLFNGYLFNMTEEQIDDLFSGENKEEETSEPKLG